MKKNGQRDADKGGDRRSHFCRTSVKTADLGITDDQSSKWQRLAEVPEEEFERAVTGDGPKPTTEGITNAHERPEMRPGSSGYPAPSPETEESCDLCFELVFGQLLAALPDARLCDCGTPFLPGVLDVLLEQRILLRGYPNPHTKLTGCFEPSFSTICARARGARTIQQNGEFLR